MSDFSIRELALRKAIEFCATKNLQSEQVTKIAERFEVYLKGERESDQPNEPASEHIQKIAKYTGLRETTVVDLLNQEWIYSSWTVGMGIGRAAFESPINKNLERNLER